MATQTRNPESDISFTGTWTETATTRWTFVDDYPSQDGANQLTHGTTTAGEGLFGFSAFTVPAGSLNIVVKVTLYAYKNGGPANSFSTRIRAGSTPANADGTAITTLGNAIANIALFTQSFTLNPKTSAAWTVADVNGDVTNGLNAFGIVASDANPSISITSIQLQVDYDPGIIPVAVGDTVTLTATPTAHLLHQPVITDGLTLTDAATAERWINEWYGALHLLNMPQIGDTVTMTANATVIIPAEGIWQIPAADQVTLDELMTTVITPLSLEASGLVTLTDDVMASPPVHPVVSDSLALGDESAVLIGSWAWAGQMHLFAQPSTGDGITLSDVLTVGNDRFAEIAWIELEVPASATETSVPFGMLQSGQILIQLKYRGNTNTVRAILATNMSGHAGTFIVNDNGTEHLVTIPHGTVAQEIVLDEEVTLGNGVSCNFKHEKVSQ